MENILSCPAKEKKQARKSDGYSESLKKYWKNNVSSTAEGRCQGRQRWLPPRRPQESPRNPMEIIGKTKVFARPWRWSVVDSAGTLWTAWEI